MTLGEFKAWLDGFGAAINGAPTPEQWEAIKAKIGEVAAPVSAPPVVIPSTSPSIGQPWWVSPIVTCGGQANLNDGFTAYESPGVPQGDLPQ